MNRTFTLKASLRDSLFVINGAAIIGFLRVVLYLVNISVRLKGSQKIIDV